MKLINNRAPDLKAALVLKYDGEEKLNFNRFVKDFCIFGSPETVVSRIKELAEKVNLSYLLCSLNFITLDHALCIKSMELYAKEVMPNFTSSQNVGLVR